MLLPHEVEVIKKGGESFVIPQANLANTLRVLEKEIEKVNYPKPPVPLMPVPKVKPVIEVDPKEELLGDTKRNAAGIIGWIEKAKSFEDIKIVMKGEDRKTVMAAAKTKMKELIDNM